VAEDQDLRLAVSLVTRRSQSEDAAEHHVEEGEQHRRILRNHTLGRRIAVLVPLREDFFDATDRTYRIRAHDILANDDHGVVLEEHSCEFGGEPSSGRAVAVYHVRDGKITEIWSYAEDQYGSDAWEAEVAAAMGR
jgi:ketosteroid isomerase-like protein